MSKDLIKVKPPHGSNKTNLSFVLTKMMQVLPNVVVKVGTYYGSDIFTKSLD